MDVTLTYKKNSFVYNISPLMPISYLKTLAYKSFNIPEYLVNLSYQDQLIEKQYYESSLREYFKTTHIVIQVTESEKNLTQNPLSISNISLSNRSSKVIKLIQDEKKTKRKFDINKSHNNFKKTQKCEQCNQRNIELFSRESCKFLCRNCKESKYPKEKYILIEKGNFEQCGYFYQKQLIDELNNEEKQVKSLIEKSSHERLNQIIEKVYDILDKLSCQEREIMENFPCVSFDIINEYDFTSMRRKIYSIKDNIKKREPYFLEGYIKFFKDLNKQDCLLDSLKKDVDSVQRKYNFQDMLIEIVECVSKNLSELHTSLNTIWTNYKYNLFEFSNKLETLIKKTKKNFIFNEIESETDHEKTENIESELEELIFENHQTNETHTIGNILLPKIENKRKSKSMFNKYEEEKNILTNNLNIHKRKKIFSEDNIKRNSIENDFDSSDDSEDNRKSRNKKGHKYPNNNERYSIINQYKYYTRDSLKDIQLDQVLLNEKEMNKIRKRPVRKSSIRMSIFTRNMNKFETLNASKIMKVKKKKKKISYL